MNRELPRRFWLAGGFATAAGIPRAQPVTLNGVWHGSDNCTYYVRQLDREVWWLGLSRDQGRSFANVFRGSISESGPLEGHWVDVPMGVGGVLSGGSLVLEGDQLDTQLSTTLTRIHFQVAEPEQRTSASDCGVDKPAFPEDECCSGTP